MTRRTVASGRRGLASSQERFGARARGVRRRPWRRWLGGLACLALTVAAGWALWYSSLLTVRSVEVDGVGAADAAAVRAIAAGSTGTQLARVDTGALERAVRARRSVADASVERSWPSTLAVHVVPRRPALVLQNPNGQLEVVDARGVAYATTTSRIAGVPLVSATSNAAVTADALTAALSVVRALPPTLGHSVRDITVSSASLVTFTTDHTQVVWGGSEQAPLKVRIISALLRQKPRLIDVSAPRTPVSR